MRAQETSPAIAAGRQLIFDLAKADGETVFAYDVVYGCWDHRRDVATAIMCYAIAGMMTG